MFIRRGERLNREPDPAPLLVETCKGAGSGSRLSRSPRRINMAEIYRSVEDSESFATPSRKPRADCPVGHCIIEALAKIFASAQNAMERDLAKTTLADVMEMVKSSEPSTKKKASSRSLFLCNCV